MLSFKNVKFVRDFLNYYFGYDSFIVAIWSEELEPLIGMEIQLFLSKTPNVEFHIILHRDKFLKISNEADFAQKKYQSSIAKLVRNATKNLSRNSLIIIPSIGLGDVLQAHLPSKLNGPVLLYPVRTTPIVNSANYWLTFNVSGSEYNIVIDESIYGSNKLIAIANKTFELGAVASEHQQRNDVYIEKILTAILIIAAVLTLMLRILIYRYYASTKSKPNNASKFNRFILHMREKARQEMLHNALPQPRTRRRTMSASELDDASFNAPLNFSGKIPSGRIIAKKENDADGKDICSEHDNRRDKEQHTLEKIEPKFTELQEKNRRKLVEIFQHDFEAKEMIMEFLSWNPQALIFTCKVNDLERFLLNRLHFTKHDHKEHKRNQHNFINLPDGSFASLTPQVDKSLGRSGSHTTRAKAKSTFFIALRDSLQNIDLGLNALKQIEKKQAELVTKRFANI